MVIVKDMIFIHFANIIFYLFMEKVHVAYIPDGYITVLVKIARVVDVFARRLSGSGTYDMSNQGVSPEYSSATWSDGCYRGQTYVYADAWS